MYEQTVTSDPVRKVRRWPKVAAGIGIAAGTAAGAAAIAAAASGGTQSGAPTLTAGSGSSGSSPTQSSNGSGTGTAPAPGAASPRPRVFGGSRFAGMGLGGPGGRVVHGTFTVQGPNGSYENLQEQAGTVSSITNTSGNNWIMTVTSADGTALTYSIDSGTSIDGGESGVSSIAKGDTVYVLATVSGGTATAKQIHDSTVLKSNGQSWMPSPPTGANSGSSSSTDTSA